MDSNIPGGRLGRLAKMAVTGARAGAGVLLGNREDTALAAAQALGSLRALAAKMGQMAGYVDGVIPAAHRDAYEKAMETLQAATPPSPPAAVRRRVEAELGKPIAELFAHFSEHPFASASIGQVHHARLHDGREVVVKVQHPGVDVALESDLNNTGLLEGMLNALGGSRIHASGMFEELRTRFREELDYTLEATRQTQFAAIHVGDPTIRVPEVVASHSTRRVLTSSLAQGIPFSQAILANEEQRRAWAETMWRFVFKGNLKGGMFNADPHPGNYLFQPHGVVVFLDFGCVQPIEEPMKTHANNVHHAALERDEAGFSKHAALLAGTRPGPYQDMAVRFMRGCFDPIFQSPFLITREYAGSLLGTLTAMANASRTMASRDVTEMPPGILFLNRLNFGFYSVLARLNVRVDYRAVEKAFMGDAT